MDRFLNAVKSQAGALAHGLGQPRFGIVTSVDPQNATARVLIQPEAVLSGWLPVLSPWIGSGWGMSCPPSPLPSDEGSRLGAWLGSIPSAGAVADSH